MPLRISKMHAVWAAGAVSAVTMIWAVKETAAAIVTDPPPWWPKSEAVQLAAATESLGKLLNQLEQRMQAQERQSRTSELREQLDLRRDLEFKLLEKPRDRALNRMLSEVQTRIQELSASQNFLVQPNGPSPPR